MRRRGARRLVLRYGIVGLLAAGLLSGCSGTGELEAQNQELKSQVESLSAVKESLEGEKESLSSELASAKEQKEEAGKKAAALQATIDEMAKEAEIQGAAIPGYFLNNSINLLSSFITSIFKLLMICKYRNNK